MVPVGGRRSLFQYFPRKHPRCEALQCCALLLVAAYLQAAAAKCTALSNGEQACSLPEQLGNFQGNFRCGKHVQLAQPGSVADLQQLVKSYNKVTAVGVGHSWWKEQFCAGSHDDGSLNVMTIALPLTNTRLSFGHNSSRMVVDEDKLTVKVAAGVLQRDLLKYLGNYRSLRSPMGYTLPAFSWFLDQTIAGAVATDTHGSSFRHASLSSQVVAMTVVLANGTVEEFTEARSAHLWKALQVSVGRLGVVVDLTINIVRQTLVVRSKKDFKFEDFIPDLQTLQDTYRRLKQGKISGDDDALIDKWDEATAFWFVPLGEVIKVSFQRFDSSAAQLEQMVKSLAGDNHTREDDEEGDDYVQQAGWTAMTGNAKFWSRLYKRALRMSVMPGAFKSEWAYLSMTKEASEFTANFPYDQYEVAIPLELAADCLLQVGKEVYGPKELWQGFRTPPLIRFVNQEAAYLSPTHGGARMYINLEDYVSYASKSRNSMFQEVLSLFRTKCHARLHWGKCGWPEHAGCFDGSKEYPNTWCHFGCAVHQLDPHGKFSSASDVWQWRAQRAGKEVPFQQCCGPTGFDYKSCHCAKRKTCQGQILASD